MEPAKGSTKASNSSLLSADPRLCTSFERLTTRALYQLKIKNRPSGS
jgi:hypothetical protein